MITKIDPTEFHRFFESYLQGILFVTDSEDERHITIYDIDKDAKAILHAHAYSFFSRCHFYVEFEPTQDFEQLGHDFAMTQTGQGVGFWDGDWPKYGDTLTTLTMCYSMEVSFEDLI